MGTATITVIALAINANICRSLGKENQLKTRAAPSVFKHGSSFQVKTGGIAVCGMTPGDPLSTD